MALKAYVAPNESFPSVAQIGFSPAQLIMETAAYPHLSLPFPSLSGLWVKKLILDLGSWAEDLHIPLVFDALNMFWILSKDLA